MTDREKFLFDLQGFLRVENFLTAEELKALNDAVDANQHRRGEDGNSATGDSKVLKGHKRGMFSGMLTWEQPHCQPFRDLLAHKKAIPYLNTMHGRGWKIDHSPFLLTSDIGTEGLILHGSTARHFDGSQYYTYQNGQIRCGMIVMQYQLHDVNEGDGGLCCIPGSHKANFPMTKGIREWEEDRQVVYNIPGKAGDLIIFNEATIHGTLPWTAKQERRSLLIRYSPKYLHFAGGYYKTELPEWVSELTEAQQATLEPPYIYNRPLIEDDGVTVVKPRREG
ncbi:MAG: phytanoyl-CoA dioxygenase family protein [Candidatus Poribacteria bacterium]|nr:phytanoyl-CoA dioxygenase family protein [Candidatus Poribacteria bacterium]